MLKVKKIPMRMCIACREMKPKKELTRVVRTVDGELRLDHTGKLNGRGAYLCKDSACIKKAAKTGALSRVFEIPVPPEIYEALEKEIKVIDE